MLPVVGSHFHGAQGVESPSRPTVAIGRERVANSAPAVSQA